MRDEFTKSTIDQLAKRAGCLCSYPECRTPTFGAASGDDGFVNVGVACHITAAAPGGPRYDQSLTSNERSHQRNGIWLCQTHGKLIDSDERHFTVDMLRGWKQSAEDRSFRALVVTGASPDYGVDRTSNATPDQELVEKLGLHSQDTLQSVAARLIAAARLDLNAFKSTPGWPLKAVPLNLRMTSDTGVRAFHASALAEAIPTFNEIVIVALPGTGKTTTMLQLVEATILRGNSVAAFVPLGEWSSRTDSLLQSIVHRQAFVGLRDEHLKLLAHCSALILVLDGWNELDVSSRKRATGEIRALQREFPKLGIVISTRRQALDVPISGPQVEIDSLAEHQQIEIARALRGSQGEAILDQALRTSGLRELVAIPLYLTALLTHIPGETLPTTKEEVLRLFVREHERAADKADALREVVFGFHTEALTALAVEATRAANTTLSEFDARFVVKRVEDRLIADGQITIPPQPMSILDALVSQHLLVRSGADRPGGGISFQHQQFQEWYASFEVERLMRAAAADRGSRERLRADVLDLRVWEEPILFACERTSRGDESGAHAVAAAILETLRVDPILAAEMIHRSSVCVWEDVKEKVIMFAKAWHVSGKVDRAVRFMITTGRGEFAQLVWPLCSHADPQVHLAAFRAARRFRPSVLGADIEARIELLPEHLRESILSEIAGESGLDGIDLAATLAKVDASPKVKASVIEALQFRRADRLVAEILRTAPDEVWKLLATKGYMGEVADPDAAARLMFEQQKYVETEADPLKKLIVLLEAGRSGAAVNLEIVAVIEAVDFPVSEQSARWNIDRAHELYPEEVRRALLYRLEAGREIPFRSEELLQAVGITIDQGPLVDIVLDPKSPLKVAGAAVGVVGPKTVGKLIDVLIATDAELTASNKANEIVRQEYQRLLELISRTGTTPFIQSIVNRSSILTPSEIALLAELVARQGPTYDQPPQQIAEGIYENMIAAVGRWAEFLLVSSEATRQHLANIARAIERMAAPALVPVLQRLLAADLSRWRSARAKHVAGLGKGIRIDSDAQHSFTLQYRRAFAAIGDTQVVEVMKAYLSDSGYCGFGLEAAGVLKDIWDRNQNSQKSNRLISWPDFSEVKLRRMERQKENSGPSSPLADEILRVVDELINSDSTEDAQHAAQLATVAFSMRPYGNRAATIDKLLQLVQSVHLKRKLLTVLVLAGEFIKADTVLDAIKALVDELKTRRYVLHDQEWLEWEEWLQLIPFSDRPEATLEALELIDATGPPPWRLRGLLSALGDAPSPVAQEILALLPRRDPRVFDEHSWFVALDKRGAPGWRLLLDFVCEGVSRLGGMDGRTFSRKLSGAMVADPHFRAEAYSRYERLPSGPARALLERAMAEIADTDGVLTLVRCYANEGRTFDGLLDHAVGQAAVGQRPSADWAGSQEVFSVPVTELRKELFAMIRDNTAAAALATASLNAIDEIRDDYGPAESEPRHPDIAADVPWPAVG